MAVANENSMLKIAMDSAIKPMAQSLGATLPASEVKKIVDNISKQVATSFKDVAADIQKMSSADQQIRQVMNQAGDAELQEALRLVQQPPARPQIFQSDLQRERIAEQRQAQNPQEYLQSPEAAVPTARPIESANIEPQVMNPAAEELVQRRQQAQEMAHKAEMNQRRIEAMAQTRAIRTPEIPEPIQADQAARTQAQAAIGDYQSQMRNMLAQDSRLQYLDQQRQLIRQKMANAEKQVKDKMQKMTKELVEKGTKKLAEWAARGFGRGSVAEWEGLFAWLWSILGWVVSVMQLVMTAIPKKTMNKLPGGGIVNLMMVRYDLKDPFVWAIDLPYLFITVFVFFMLILVLVNVFFAIIGSYIVGGTLIYDLFFGS